MEDFPVEEVTTLCCLDRVFKIKATLSFVSARVHPASLRLIYRLDTDSNLTRLRISSTEKLAVVPSDRIQKPSLNGTSESSATPVFAVIYYVHVEETVR